MADLLAGKYEIRGTLGQGAYGIVYLGWQEDLHRNVAVKELAPQMVADPAFLQQFRYEAQIMAQLDNPNCVKVYDFIEVEGRAFLVSEYVDGATLKIVSFHLSPARRLPSRAPSGVDPEHRPPRAGSVLDLALRSLEHEEAAGAPPVVVLVEADGIAVGGVDLHRDELGPAVGGPLLGGLQQIRPDPGPAVIGKNCDVDLSNPRVAEHPRLAAGLPELDLDPAHDLARDVGDQDLGVVAKGKAVPVPLHDRIGVGACIQARIQPLVVFRAGHVDGGERFRVPDLRRPDAN